MKPANIETLIKHNNELLDWKYSASQILSNIDLPKIGKIIGVELGKDISVEVLPFIEKSVNEIDQMKNIITDLVFEFELEDRSGTQEDVMYKAKQFLKGRTIDDLPL